LYYEEERSKMSQMSY